MKITLVDVFTTAEYGKTEVPEESQLSTLNDQLRAKDSNRRWLRDSMLGDFKATTCRMMRDSIARQRESRPARCCGGSRG